MSELKIHQQLPSGNLEEQKQVKPNVELSEKMEKREVGQKRTFPGTGKRSHLVGDASKIGSSNGHWKGGVVTKKDGRTLLHRPDHPFCSKDGYVLRYRIVMEEHLGRHLKPSEIVHHKNHDHTDDRIENLEIMDRGEHMKIHGNLDKYRAWQKTLWAMKYDKCINCGTTDIPHAGHGQCKRCRQKSRYLNQKSQNK